MHLLQSGTDLAVIALWMGHSSPSVTHHYLEADLAAKEAALQRLTGPPLCTRTRTIPAQRPAPRLSPKPLIMNSATATTRQPTRGPPRRTAHNGGLHPIGNVGYPAAVRRRCSEVAFQQVRWPLLASRAGHSGPRPLLPGPQALQAHLAHQPLDRAPRDLDPVTIQLTPHLLGTVKIPPFLSPCLGDCLLQLLVAFVTRGRIILSRLRRIIGGRRYLQDRAGRLHSEPVLVRIDELD